MSAGSDTGDGAAGGEARAPVAVALSYEAGETPTVVAKGRGEVATKIMETAEAHGIAIERNPSLAEALSAVDLDDHIPEALFRAVAEVIAFVLRTRDRMTMQASGDEPLGK